MKKALPLADAAWWEGDAVIAAASHLLRLALPQYRDKEHVLGLENDVCWRGQW